MKEELFFLESETGRPAATGALFHVLPAPLEKSVSYGTGASRGPKAIIAASQELELFDQGHEPGRAGIHTLPSVDCRGSAEKVLARIEKAVAHTVAMQKIPVVLGGEHTVTLGAVKAVADRFPDMGIVHLDAHADLRQAYQGNPLSHASVMRRVVELGLPLAQFGIRSLCREEALLQKENPRITCTTGRALYDHGIPEPVLPLDFPQDIYISFDIDFFDPSLVPATGTPEPGGSLWWDTVALLEAICRGRRVRGFDLVELAPVPAMHASDFIGAKTAYTLMRLAADQKQIAC